MNTDKKTFLLPLVAVFCASMIVVISTFYVSMSSVQQEREKKATELMNKTEEALTTRLKIYEEVLRSAAGIFVCFECFKISFRNISSDRETIIHCSKVIIIAYNQAAHRTPQKLS
jgi:hypothetical protein